jgi:PAS domain S-box-containing protein
MRGKTSENADVNSQSPRLMPVLSLGALVMALSIAASGWIYVEGNRAVRAEARAVEAQAAARGQAAPVTGLLHRIDAWALRMTLASVASSAGLVGAMALGLALWRRPWARRIRALGEQLTDATKKLTEATSLTQRLSSDKERVEEELRTLAAEIEKRIEERTATLARAHAALEQELNDRKHAEKMLAMQSKELERSKGVLEMHVQARTLELQKLQRRYESILNSAGEGIYGLDLSGKTVFVNPAAAKLTGWRVDEVVGKTEAEVFRPACPVAEPGQAEHSHEQIFHRKDGSAFPVEYMRTPIKENNRLVGEVVIFKDITERKRTEDALARKAAELARSNAELEQFAFVASHDLQEPLRKIQAFGDRLKTKVDAVQLTEGRDYLERMQSAAARMQTLINDLLTFSRVISASQPFVPVDLNAVVKGVLSDLEVRIEQTKAQVEVGQLPTLEADPMQMRQLVQNLIGNALKFQPPGQAPHVKIQGQVRKKPLPDGGEEELCELVIQDNGIGFDEKYLDKIFAVFQRLHGRTEYEGTGVGLAVCRRITDRHGGTITAHSKPGEGATFVVSLPLRHAAKPAVEPAAPATEERLAA